VRMQSSQVMWAEAGVAYIIGLTSEVKASKDRPAKVVHGMEGW
jgi:hypothetical protein